MHCCNAWCYLRDCQPFSRLDPKDGSDVVEQCGVQDTELTITQMRVAKGELEPSLLEGLKLTLSTTSIIVRR